MSWTRSAAVRAGFAGAAGAALILSTLPPLTATSSTAAPATGADESAIVLAGSDLSVTWPLDSERIAAVEAARYGQAASRSAEREALQKQEPEAVVACYLRLQT